MGSRVNQAVISANRLLGELLALLRTSKPEGVLTGVTLPTRSFAPGHRTADASAAGGLGDASGVTVIRPDDDLSHRWSLHDLARIEEDDGGLVDQALGTEVRVLAGEGGTYVLRAHDNNAVVGEVLLSVPYLVSVSHSHASMRPALAALGVPEADHDRRWSAVARAAEIVAAHVLRPANVRLDWQGQSHDQVMAALDDQTAPTLLARRTRLPRPRRDIRVDVGPAEDLLDDVTRWALSIARSVTTKEDDVGWHTVLTSRLFGIEGWSVVARVTARLGDPDGDDVDQALHALASAATDADGERRWAEAAGRLLGVSVGRGVLRALGLRPATPDLPSGRGDVEPCEVVSVTPAHELASLLGLHRPAGRSPADLPTDLASVADDAGSAERRAAMTGAWGDLVALFGSEWGVASDAPTRYDVLAGVVSPRHLESTQLLAPLPAPYGRRTLIPGSVDAEFADDGSVTTPARYGSQEDDPDGRHTAVAELQADLRRVGIDYGLAEVGRYGYLRINFRAGVLDPRVFDGAPGDAFVLHAAAASRRVQTGHTGLAVRELQIAARYPNDVVEQPTVAAPYADRLAVAGTDADRADDGTPGTPLDDPDGELDPATALELRTWVFARRRLPVVVEARQQVGGASDWTVPNTELFADPRAHNLLGPDDVATTDPRMFVLDLSGMPQELGGVDIAAERRVLGDHSGPTGFGGPRSRAAHRIEPLTLDETFGATSAVHVAPAIGTPDPGDDWLPTGGTTTAAQVRGWFTSGWRVLDAVTRAETGGSWDGFNGYDSAVWSYPMFHFTLLGVTEVESAAGDFLGYESGQPGKMAHIVRWLQDRPGDVPEAPDRRGEVHDLMQAAYQRTFGRYGIGAGPLGNDLSGYLHIAGLRTVTGGTAASPWTIDMATTNWQTANAAVRGRQQALYDAYAQWFRSWQWAARFVRNLRFDDVLQRLLVAHALDWTADALERTIQVGQVNRQVDGSVTSEVAAAAYLRTFVKSPGQSNIGFRAVPVATWTANQTTAAQQFIAAITVDGLRDSATTAMNRPGLSATTLPTTAQLREARDWVLRSLLPAETP
jgi:hypothetical protein